MTSQNPVESIAAYQPHCCHIGCENTADVEIRYSGQTEDYTQMCNDHRDEYLNDVSEVYPINKYTPKSAIYQPPKRELEEIRAELSLIVKELQEINSNDSVEASGFIGIALKILKTS